MKHYHVLAGLAGGYMPDTNEIYSTIKEARMAMQCLVKIFRDGGDRYTGSMLQNMYISTDGNFYLEVVECREVECYECEYGLED